MAVACAMARLLASSPRQSLQSLNASSFPSLAVASLTNAVLETDRFLTRTKVAWGDQLSSKCHRHLTVFDAHLNATARSLQNIPQRECCLVGDASKTPAKVFQVTAIRSCASWTKGLLLMSSTNNASEPLNQTRTSSVCAS